MAKLIHELKTRFPKTWILGHRDLPGVWKECPCYDVGADQNGEMSSQSMKTLPRIRDRSMHRVQKLDPNLGDIYAQGAETCLRFRGHLCTGVQKHDSDSGHTYARGAETCLRFRAELCTVCRMFSQKWI
jgi:hypothetical protein